MMEHRIRKTLATILYPFQAGCVNHELWSNGRWLAINHESGVMDFAYAQQLLIILH